MRLGFGAKYEYRDGLSICVEDDALSDRRWIVGSVAICVTGKIASHEWYDGREPRIEITSNQHFMPAGEMECDATELTQALIEAKAYAAAMHLAILGHLRRLAHELGTPVTVEGGN